MYRLASTIQSVAVSTSMQNVYRQSLYAVHTAMLYKDYTQPRCPACHHLQEVGMLHTSSTLTSKRPMAIKKSKKKMSQKSPLVNKTKSVSVRKTWPVATIKQTMTVQELSRTLDRDIDLIFDCLIDIYGKDEFRNDPSAVIDNFEVITLVCEKTAHRWYLEPVRKITVKKNKDVFKRPPPDRSKCVKRPPVVTIMGHVDHGKTSLLDKLRHSNIIDKEFGGITQHIGTFSVCLASGQQLTFIDTPGHAAFTSMRLRGAQVTDIIIMVIAADDGVMAQTVESFKHAERAKVPVIIAINKMDKPGADLEHTKQSLLHNGMILEEEGGDIQSVPISALKGTNLDQLQEAILTLAEMLDISADPTGLVEGVIIESKTSERQGKIATVIIQRGTLKKGNCLVAGTSWAKVRKMFDDRGQIVSQAPPGIGVEVDGWKELPSAGDSVLQVQSEAQAREVVSWRREENRMLSEEEDYELINKKRESHSEHYKVLRNEALDMGRRFTKIFSAKSSHQHVDVVATDSVESVVSVVVKGDVDGSVEAILQLLYNYNCPHCQLNVLQHGVGQVTEWDVNTAAEFNGVVYAFNVEVPTKIKQLAASQNVAICEHNIIYKMMDDIRDRLQENTAYCDEHDVVGEAKVQEIFTVTSKKEKILIAGSKCIKGNLVKDKHFKLIRDGETLMENQALSSLRHFKEEVTEIDENQDCGVRFQNQSIVPESGDTVICYDISSRRPTIEWDLNF